MQGTLRHRPIVLLLRKTVEYLLRIPSYTRQIRISVFFGLLIYRRYRRHLGDKLHQPHAFSHAFVRKIRKVCFPTRSNSYLCLIWIRYDGNRSRQIIVKESSQTWVTHLRALFPAWLHRLVLDPDIAIDYAIAVSATPRPVILWGK